MKVFRLALFVELFFLASSFVSGATTTYDKITVQEIPLADSRSDMTIHGYVEYRFRVSNRDSQPHRVMLIVPTDGFGGSHRGSSAITRITDSVDVPPNSSATIRLLQPPFGLNGNSNIQVVIDGRYQKDPLAFQKVENHVPGYSRHSHETANLFISQKVSAEIRDLMKDGVPAEKPKKEDEQPKGAVTPTRSYGTPSRTDPELFPWLANGPVSDWSDNWLAYTRFDCVVMTNDDWRELNEGNNAGVLAAIRSYVETGGMLGIVGTGWTAPKEWIIGPEAKNEYLALFGRVFVMDNDKEKIKSQIAPFRNVVITKQVQPWKTAMGNGGGYYRGRFGGSATGSGAVLSDPESLLQMTPVVKSYGVPVKTVLALIVLFAILIGPVNILLLSRMNRRIWLLWTVPLTSLIAALMVFGISFVQEGFLRQSGSTTFTVLDQRRGEATTIGFLGYYSTLTPSGLLFSPQTEATACLPRGYGSESRSLEVNLVAGGNQLFSRGWASARIPSYFMIRKAESQRKERLNFDWDEKNVTNGLGVKINNLVVCSPKGEYFKADKIEPGQKTTLTAMDAKNKVSDTETWKKVRTDYDSFFNAPSGSHELALRNALNSLSAGKYRAEIDVWNPFVEPGIDKMVPYGNKTTILGLFE